MTEQISRWKNTGETIIQFKISEWDNNNEFDAFYPYMQDAVFISITDDYIYNQVFVSA